MNSNTKTSSPKMPASVRANFFRRSYEPVQQPNNIVVIPDFIKRNTMFNNNQKCQLCQESHPKEQMDCIGNCGHTFCITCLGTYCIYKINTMESVTCPKEGCHESMDPNGKVFHRLPEQSQQRYKRNDQWKMTTKNPNLRLCPSQKCDGVMNTERGNFNCPKCGKGFCKDCQMPQHAGACDTNFQQKYKDWKRCPTCHIFIQRTEGCNHMVCRCKHQFCYMCLSNWTNDHYFCKIDYIQRRDQWMLQYSRCQQILLGLLRILLFPLAIVVYLLGFVIGVILCVIICFFCGPVLIIAVCCSDSNSCWIGCILCPVFMVVGALIGLVLGVFGGLASMVRQIFEYLRASAVLICDPPEREESNQGTLIEPQH